MKHLLLLVFISIITSAMAQQRYYNVSGKVIDAKTKKGISGLYVALQGLTIAAFFGDAETFEDLWIDSTDRNGHFHIRAPAKLVDSFIEANSGLLDRYSFALDVRTNIEPWIYVLYKHKHVIPALNGIDDGHSRNRLSLNRCTIILSDINMPITNDTSGIVVPFYPAGNLQFWLPERDSAFLKDAYLYVSVQELSKTGKVLRHGHTSYDRDHLSDVTLVKPYVPINIILGKGIRSAHGIDTFAIIKNITLQPNEVRRIRLTSPYH